MRSESTAYISFFAKQFHSPRLPIVHNFHSLLRHLLTSEFAVLLFDCERNKLEAQSIPQLFSKLGAIVFFVAFFLKRKRVPLKRVPPYFLFFQKFEHSCKTCKADRAAVVSDHFAKDFDLADKDCKFTGAGKCGI